MTGAAGFLGAGLTDALTASGVRVIGIDLAEGVPSRAGEFVGLDLLDADALRTDFATHLDKDVASAVVIHLAGRGHVGAIHDDPRGAVAANIVGTTNVLEACRDAGVRRVVFPSSALVYRRPAESPLGEDAPVESTSLYAATKLAVEALLQAYAAEYEFSATVARLGNVYGHGAAPDSVASIVIRQALAGGPVVVNTFAPVRDFIYRDDVVAGLIALAERTGAPDCELDNLSSGVATSIGELAEAACAVAGLKAKPTERPGTATDPRDSLVLSIDRLTEATGWIPAFSLESGLRATFAESRG